MENLSKMQKLMIIVSCCSFLGAGLITFIEPSETSYADAFYYLVAAFGLFLTFISLKWNNRQLEQVEN